MANTRLTAAALVALLSSACAHSPPPPPAANGAPAAAAPTTAAAAPPTTAAAAAPVAANVLRPQLLAADTPSATAAGATFTAPSGWTLLSDGARRVLESPEHDFRLALVDEPDAKSADDAVAKAWPLLLPGFKRPLHIAQDQPGRHGWEETRGYDYETSPNEKHVAAASAQRKGKGWLVVLLDGDMAAAERRGAQLGLVMSSLRPAGYARESFAGKKAAPLDAARLAKLTEFIEKARQAGDVPGVAISLVQDGKVVFEGGFGVRALGKKDKVDADTLFMIASNTKALTTLLLAKEVDLGRFGWETPVTQVYPSFKLGDEDTTRHVLMKHLVCACTGMPRQDLEWLLNFKEATPESTMRLLGTFKPTSKFGEVFQYSNIMAAAAGFIGGHVLDPKSSLGAAYDKAMQREIFAPLGMKSTTFDSARALKANHAQPHADDLDGHVKPASMAINYSIIPARPAGAAWSSVRDLTKYVQLELANGKLPDGKPLVSESSLLERRKPQVQLGEDRVYGMGLMVDKHWGTPVVHHGGDLVGFHSDMFWLPEVGVGGVILTNADDGVLLRGPFLRRTLEVLFDGNLEAEEDVMNSIAKQKEAVAIERKRLVLPAEADAVRGLAHKYHNELLGDVEVVHAGADTILRGEITSKVASRKNDDGTYSLFTSDPGLAGFEFVVGERDHKPTLTTRDGQHEYVFVAQ